MQSTYKQSFSKQTFIELLAILIVAVFLGGLLTGCTAMAPQKEAEEALRSDSRVLVKQGKFLAFEPLAGAAVSATEEPQGNAGSAFPSIGLIIYPGAKVDPRAYAPQAKALAAQGYLVAIVPVAFSFAIFSPNRADWVLHAYPEIQNWVVAGHSLGGVAAAQYAVRHKNQIRGIVFWASYPASDISQSGIPVLSISASLDGLATPEKVEGYKKNQPADTQYVVIQGGNHAQFGWYEPQKGDRAATISAEEQTAQIVEATAAFLQKLEKAYGGLQ
ncbi:alpha/beta hydrolase [Gracilinema caldarium]|uniref:alpha/beta hydrolase n=1 Tax=Gracilinema caldarium TaxID=215591 RepID=UPI0026EC9F04|nr:alpha/beta hydrolase [Gracilinema caldarium]